MSLIDATKLALKILSKTMDSTSLTTEKCTLLFVLCVSHSPTVEFAHLTKDAMGRVVFRELDEKVLGPLLKEHLATLEQQQEKA
jgi:hypothetical protein